MRGKTRIRARGPLGAGAPQTVDDYLARIPEPSRRALARLRAAIRSAAPQGAVETISYRIPAFRYLGMLGWYAAFADHCSFFPSAAAIKAFRDDLKDFTVTKGSIHFTPEKQLPLSLIRKLVQARVKQNEGRGGKPRPRGRT